jgi:hypothetical protein
MQAKRILKCHIIIKFASENGDDQHNILIPSPASFSLYYIRSAASSKASSPNNGGEGGGGGVTIFWNLYIVNELNGIKSATKINTCYYISYYCSAVVKLPMSAHFIYRTHFSHSVSCWQLPPQRAPLKQQGAPLKYSQFATEMSTVTQWNILVSWRNMLLRGDTWQAHVQLRQYKVFSDGSPQMAKTFTVSFRTFNLT